MAMTLDGTSGITQMTGSIVMSGSTSGTTTIIPSAVAGTTTVTMPAVTGTMMVSGNMPAFSAYNNRKIKEWRVDDFDLAELVAYEARAKYHEAFANHG